MDYPGIPEELLASIEEPNPLDVGTLRQKVATFASPPDAPLQLILNYGRFLLAANQRLNLTGAKDWETLIENHFIDCLEAANFIPEDVRTIADWGSGAGLPGVLWSIIFPEKQLLLCEKKQKRSRFIEEALTHLELFQTEVLAGQAEEQLKAYGEVDALCARAVEPLHKLLPRIRRNKIRFKALFLMAGPNWEKDWDAMKDEQRTSWKIAARHPYNMPNGLGKRHLLVFRPKS